MKRFQVQKTTTTTTLHVIEAYSDREAIERAAEESLAIRSQMTVSYSATEVEPAEQAATEPEEDS